MLHLLLSTAIIFAHAPESAEAPLEGRWRNPSGSVIIFITSCGGSLCGRVQWASDKATADALKGGTDPLVGAELISDIVPKGEGRWKARLFVPDVNKRSKGELRQLGSDQLKVTGCAVGRLVCKSQVWTRTEAE